LRRFRRRVWRQALDRRISVSTRSLNVCASRTLPFLSFRIVSGIGICPRCISAIAESTAISSALGPTLLFFQPCRSGFFFHHFAQKTANATISLGRRGLPGRRLSVKVPASRRSASNRSSKSVSGYWPRNKSMTSLKLPLRRARSHAFLKVISTSLRPRLVGNFLSMLGRTHTTRTPRLMGGLLSPIGPASTNLLSTILTRLATVIPLCRPCATLRRRHSTD
jgi:hypothetical protein